MGPENHVTKREDFFLAHRNFVVISAKVGHTNLFHKSSSLGTELRYFKTEL